MAVEEHIELASKEEIDPNQQDRCHSGNLTVRAGIEPLARPVDGLDPGLRMADDGSSAYLLQPGPHLAGGVGSVGELVPARGGQRNRHVHLAKERRIRDGCAPFGLEPGRDAGGEALREGLEICQTPIPKNSKKRLKAMLSHQKRSKNTRSPSATSSAPLTTRRTS